MAVALSEGKRLKETQPVLIAKKFFKIFFFVVVVYRLFLLRHMGYLPHGMWELSSWIRDRTCTSSLEGGFLTTGSPGKSSQTFFFKNTLKLCT